MKSKWPLAKLRDILEQNTTIEELEADKNYRLLGVRLEGKGPFIREEKYGSQIRTNKLRRVTSGEFIYSRLFAWRGAFGLIPPDMSAAFVSNEFPTFKINEERVLPRFLEMYFKQKWVWDKVETYCTGTTKASRNRFNESFFLNLEIPVPPLVEQKRIVAKIEGLMARVEEARKLRGKEAEEVERLSRNSRDKTFSEVMGKGIELMKLDEAAPINMGQSPPGDSYNSIGEGIPLLNGPSEFGERHPEEIQWTTVPTKLCKKGDILVCVRGATTGRMNWADKEYCIGRGLAALSPKTDVTLPEYIYRFVETQTQKMLVLAAGSTFPNLPGAKLKTIDLPMPPLQIQRGVVAYLNSLQSKIDELKKLQAETEKELEGLVPSILDKAFKGEL